MIIGDTARPPYSRMAIPCLLMDRIDEAGTYRRKDPGHFLPTSCGISGAAATDVIA